MTKVRATAKEAIADLRDGMSVLCGGFGLCGNAEALIAAVANHDAKDLTLISNNAGNLGKGLATWLEAGIVSNIICTYVGTNEVLQRMMAMGQVEVSIIPQGTFVERIRAGGAGIAAFYTPTGAGTVVAEGKEVRVFNGREHLLERAITADFALIRARQADAFGNLRFYRTARNFSPIMATAAKTTVVECDELVPLGTLDPDDVHLPGAFVKRVVHVPEHEDIIEYAKTRPRADASFAQ